jgi:hypothetical protein
MRRPIRRRPPTPANPDLARQAFLQIVDNQLRLNDPPETRITYQRLRALGHSDADARRLIAQAVFAEINRIQSTRTPFDRASFAADLARLPAPPWDD